MSCVFCDLLKNPQKDATFIHEFEQSVAFLNFNQSLYLGQSMLILKEHHDHVHLTPIALQQAVIPELTSLTKAILKAFGGIRANHESLGNSVSHVHWHIVPRYAGDMNTGQRSVQNLPFIKLSDDEYKAYAEKIRLALE